MLYALLNKALNAIKVLPSMKENLIVLNHSFPTIRGDFLFNCNNRPFILKPKRNRCYAQLRNLLKISSYPTFERHFLKLSFLLCRFHVGILFTFAALGISSL